MCVCVCVYVCMYVCCGVCPIAFLNSGPITVILSIRITLLASMKTFQKYGKHEMHVFHISLFPISACFHINTISKNNFFEAY